MSLNRIVIHVLFLLSLAFTHANAQKYPQVVVYEADTVIIFDIEQGKKLAIFNEQRKYLEKANQELNGKISYLDTVVQLQDEQIKNYVEIEKKQLEIIEQKQKQMDMNDKQVQALRQEIKKQKNQKRISIGLGVIITSALTYFYITH